MLIHLKVRYSHHVLCQYNFQHWPLMLINPISCPNHGFPIIQLFGQRYNNEWQCPVWMIFWFRTKYQQIHFAQRLNWSFGKVVGFPPGRIGSAGWIGCSGTNCWSCSNWFPGQVLKDLKDRGDGRDTGSQICISTRNILFTNRLQFVGGCQETIPEVQPEAKQEQQEGGSSGSQCLNSTKWCCSSLDALKPYEKWHVLYINWCLVSSINNIVRWYLATSGTQVLLWDEGQYHCVKGALLQVVRSADVILRRW